MAGEALKPNQLPTSTNHTSNSYVIVTTVVNTTVLVSKLTLGALFSNVVFDYVVDNDHSLILKDKSTPVNSTTNVIAGRFWNDNNYLYIALSNNSIKRVPLESF